MKSVYSGIFWDFNSVMPRKFILLYSFFGSMLINILAFLAIAVFILVGITAFVIVFRIVYCRIKMKIFQANLFLSLWEYVLVLSNLPHVTL